MKNNFSNRNTNGRHTFRPRNAVRRLCALALLLAGCAESPTLEPQDGAAGNETEQVTVCLDLAPDILSSVEVKATGAIDENVIRDAWVFQLKPDGSAQVQAPQYTDKVSASADGSYRIEVSLTSQDSKVYIVTNTHNSSWGTGFTTQAALEAASFSIPNHTALENGIPMSGIWTGTPSATVGILGRISLTRVVSKITLNISLGDEMLPGKFVVTNLALQAIPTEVKVFGENTEGIGADYEEKGISVEAPLTREYYMPEYLAGTSAGLSPIDRNPACLLPDGKTPSFINVEGTYTGPSELQVYGLIFYIFLGENNINDYNVRRNTHYTVNVTIRGLDKADVRIEKHQAYNQIFNFAEDSYPEIYITRDRRYDISYNEAQTTCPEGWRLPTKSEAQYFSFFENELGYSNEYYWTSTPDPSNPNLIYVVQPQSGREEAIDPTNQYATLRCVLSRSKS